MDEGDLLSLEEVYEWVDSVPFSRPKKNLAKDFSDGVLMAELLKHWYPKRVEMHNYYPANSQEKKLKNWITLNKKVLTKLDLSQNLETLNMIASGALGAIDPLLKALKYKVDMRSESLSRPNQNNSLLGDNENYALDSSDEYKRNLNKLQSQLKERDDAITVLNNKVAHLESMLELKERRIKDMLVQLQCYVAKEARLRDLTAQLSRSCPDTVTPSNTHKQLCQQSLETSASRSDE